MKIKNIKDLKEWEAKLEASITKPPFHSTMKVVSAGCFEAEYMFLQPYEALRLGKFLVEFYEGANECE